MNTQNGTKYFSNVFQISLHRMQHTSAYIAHTLRIHCVYIVYTLCFHSDVFMSWGNCELQSSVRVVYADVNRTMYAATCVNVCQCMPMYADMLTIEKIETKLKIKSNVSGASIPDPWALKMERILFSSENKLM